MLNKTIFIVSNFWYLNKKKIIFTQIDLFSFFLVLTRTTPKAVFTLPFFLFLPIQEYNKRNSTDKKS